MIVDKYYDRWLFDCDGVILDSNKIKTEAFRRIGLRYGDSVAEKLVMYHIENGGVSRFAKLEYLFRHILGLTDFDELVRDAVSDFGRFVRTRLCECPEVPGIREFLRQIKSVDTNRTFVVSGSDQEELRHVFAARGLDHLFDQILGSPVSKHELVRRICAGEDVDNARSVMLGDSRLDWDVARAHRVAFVMVYGFSEWACWEQEINPEVPRTRDFVGVALGDDTTTFGGIAG